MYKLLIKRKFIFVAVLSVLAVYLISYIIGGQGCIVKMYENRNLVTQMISDAIPVFYEFNHINHNTIEKYLLGFNLSSPMSIIESNVFAFGSLELPVENEESEEKEVEETVPIKETTISNKNTGSILVKNSTAYEINPNELVKEPLKFDFSGEGPHILIVHSHSSESYTATAENYYLPSDPDRTENVNYNVVRVGKEIVNTLKNHGIEVLHDTSLHDYPSYNVSYKNSLASVKKYLKKYPSIKVVLDIHRDAMVKSDGTKVKLTADIKGEKAAQIMLLSGSDQGGLEHPHWRENLKFAMKLQQTLSSMYPGLARPVSFTKERYNTHTTYGSIIIEVGTTGNTLEEALVSAKMIGNALAVFVSDN